MYRRSNTFTALFVNAEMGETKYLFWTTTFAQGYVFFISSRFEILHKEICMDL